MFCGFFFRVVCIFADGGQYCPANCSSEFSQQTDNLATPISDPNGNSTLDNYWLFGVLIAPSSSLDSCSSVSTPVDS